MLRITCAPRACQLESAGRKSDMVWSGALDTRCSKQGDADKQRSVRNLIHCKASGHLRNLAHAAGHAARARSRSLSPGASSPHARKHFRGRAWLSRPSRQRRSTDPCASACMSRVLSVLNTLENLRTGLRKLERRTAKSRLWLPLQTTRLLEECSTHLHSSLL